MDYLDNPFVPNVDWELIPLKDLVSNQDYQRNLSMNHVMKAVENFDVCQLNPVKVSRRDGVNYVFNGQHTIEMVAAASGSRDTPVWCMIFKDLDYEEEADIFASQQKYTKKLSPYEIFIANVEAGNDDQIIIKQIVTDCGMKLTSTKRFGAICAVNALEEIYNNYGQNILRQTLLLISGTWEGVPDSFSAVMLKAVAAMIAAYEDQLNIEIFKQKLGRISVKSVVRAAKERQNGYVGYAETLIAEYNKKMKNPLRYSQLYKVCNSKKTKQISSVDDIIRMERLASYETEGTSDEDFEDGLEEGQMSLETHDDESVEEDYE